MTIPVRNLYYLLSYAWNYVRTTDIAGATARDLGTVPDMLAHVLSHGVARLISRGLDRSYEPVGDALRTIRGKDRPHGYAGAEPTGCGAWSTATMMSCRWMFSRIGYCGALCVGWRF